MSTGEVIVKVMDLLRKGEISGMTPNGEVYKLVSSKKYLSGDVIVGNVLVCNGNQVK